MDMRLLVCDSAYKAYNKEYNALKSKGVELININSPEEITSHDLTTFVGIITHPGFKDQSEILRSLKEYPALKVVITSTESGTYDTKSGRAKIFSREQTDEIYEYFS